jgi:uncharacterized membrane protein
MVLMALDHVRDYFSYSLITLKIDPTDLAKTTTPLFFTRWITHFCAPTFVFLAGTGAFLYGVRGKTKPQQSWFLVSRGLWLVVLELTLVHFGWHYNFDYRVLSGAVIWVIGWSMVAMAALVFLPTWTVALIGLVLIAGHNAFDWVKPEELPSFGWLWMILKSCGEVVITPRVSLGVAYPILPWLGVMAAGYGFGTIWLLDHRRRRYLLLVLGLLVTLLFVWLRARNEYGDPSRWEPQATEWFTFLSFLNCTKYPPSLLYVLMTLGPAILALAWFDRRAPGQLSRPLVVFGRVPLFYYLLHLPLIHGLAVVMGYLSGWNEWTSTGLKRFFHHCAHFPEGWGYGLPGVYLVWLIVLLLLYPVCRWFADLKRRRSDWWLSYL